MIGVATITLFYALLALVGNVIVIGVLVLAVTSGRSSTARRWLDSMATFLAPGALWAAFGIAVLATAGSLYFSEVAGFEPCRLCWYQRIAMYPLVVVLWIGGWRRDIGVRRYAAPLAAIGALIATYHLALEWFPALDSGACSTGTPCTLVWFREFGFISLPYLALSAFLLILTVLWLAGVRRLDDEPRTPSGVSAGDSAGSRP